MLLERMEYKYIGSIIWGILGRDSLVASTRAYHATGTGIDPLRGNVCNRSRN